MIQVTKIAAQGDVLFRNIERLPNGARMVEHGEQIIIAHSETGHHHSIHDAGVTMFSEPDNPMICYLRIDGPYADVVHQRSFDTHETIRLLGPGVFEVRRQREHAPEGWRRVED